MHHGVAWIVRKLESGPELSTSMNYSLVSLQVLKQLKSDKAETQLSKYFQNDFQNLTHHHRVSSLTKTVIGG